MLLLLADFVEHSKVLAEEVHMQETRHAQAEGGGRRTAWGMSEASGSEPAGEASQPPPHPKPARFRGLSARRVCCSYRYLSLHYALM